MSVIWYSAARMAVVRCALLVCITSVGVRAEEVKVVDAGTDCNDGFRDYTTDLGDGVLAEACSIMRPCLCVWGGGWGVGG